MDIISCGLADPVKTRKPSLLQLQMKQLHCFILEKRGRLTLGVLFFSYVFAADLACMGVGG